MLLFSQNLVVSIQHFKFIQRSIQLTGTTSQYSPIHQHFPNITIKLLDCFV